MCLLPRDCLLELPQVFLEVCSIDGWIYSIHVRLYLLQQKLHKDFPFKVEWSSWKFFSKYLTFNLNLKFKPQSTINKSNRENCSKCCSFLEEIMRRIVLQHKFVKWKKNKFEKKNSRNAFGTKKIQNSWNCKEIQEIAKKLQKYSRKRNFCSGKVVADVYEVFVVS